MKSQRRGLGGCIIDQARGCDVRGQTRDGDHHAVVPLDHLRDEFLREPVVRDGVHVEGQAHIALAGVEDRLPARDAGVVDEHRGGSSVGLADRFCGGGDGGPRRDVAFVVGHVAWSVVGERLHVDDRDADVALG